MSEVCGMSKRKLRVKPYTGVSYAVDAKGVPEIVFQILGLNLFTTEVQDTESVGCVVRVMRPVVLDMKGKDCPTLPELPNDGDGFILKNFGNRRSRVYVLRNPEEQVMRIPLNRDIM